MMDDSAVYICACYLDVAMHYLDLTKGSWIIMVDTPPITTSITYNEYLSVLTLFLSTFCWYHALLCM